MAWLTILDYFKTSISLLTVAVGNLGTVISTSIPYLLILAGFGAFVFWNDGVVLGGFVRLRKALM